MSSCECSPPPRRPGSQRPHGLRLQAAVLEGKRMQVAECSVGCRVRAGWLVWFPSLIRYHSLILRCPRVQETLEHFAATTCGQTCGASPLINVIMTDANFQHDALCRYRDLSYYHYNYHCHHCIASQRIIYMITTTTTTATTTTTTTTATTTIY